MNISCLLKTRVISGYVVLATTVFTDTKIPLMLPDPRTYLFSNYYTRIRQMQAYSIQPARDHASQLTPAQDVYAEVRSRVYQQFLALLIIQHLTPSAS
jgi:hypothetical protein